MVYVEYYVMSVNVLTSHSQSVNQVRKWKLVVLVYFIFKKQLICQWWERRFLCGFVALSVRMCVAEANKIEVTMSSCLGTNEILVSKQEKHCLRSIICLVFYYNYRCLEAWHLSILMIQTQCTVMQLLKVHMLEWVLLQDISELIRLSRTVQCTYFLTFHLFQGRV